MQKKLRSVVVKEITVALVHIAVTVSIHAQNVGLDMVQIKIIETCLLVPQLHQFSLDARFYLLYF